MTYMIGRAEQIIRDHILDSWRNLAPHSHPQLLWICLHAPVQPDFASHKVNTPALAAWFADVYRVRDENIWSYLRFRTMLIDQPWRSRTIPQHTDVHGDPHRIAVATFASYADTTDYWVALWWGRLHGEGQRISGAETGRPIVQESLWKT